ncbi:MAG: 6-carboxytetrahydropterin synthase QueD [Proteobacteria bacterium]|nr:6-carboxytetrahydropterin synthase QueD [Pseudomonadota bacterium]MBU1388224.1 6-carboxytetrahydropterin synthase QueD [Pseudomonadota bacterium]MBU1543036.1 6-carboxytetrahydropterin synthase QueD [Pseudomonadota bacterium]MBU2429815.1 6-carboxytetrahydropterin synthase QueD [Pseudomonadota bacterium]MBU2482971.1 6-carboxytetrahydropterin synthase QueD [Pseudomonadota bacterium]
MAGVYEVYIKDHFAAAHVLKGYDGNCSKMHGHNWEVEAYIQCTRLSRLGFGIDFKDARSVLQDILNKLDHTTLNDVVEFSSINPTSENIAKFLYTELSRRLNTDHIKVTKVSVLESPGCGSSYQEI